MTGPRMTLCLSHAPGYARDTEARYGLDFRAGLQRVIEAVRDFAPELVVIFGSDHRKAYTDIVPAMSVVLSAEGMGDLLSPTGPYDVPKDLAKELASYLTGEHLDVGFTRHIALDHGFGQMAGVILGSLDAVPSIPVFINCASFPLAAPRRAVELGEAIGRFFETSDKRILFLASGGLSHSPPVLALVDEPVSPEEEKALSAAHREAAMDLIIPEWDHEFLASLESADHGWALQLTQADIDPAGVGANEVRTWLAAYAAGGKPLRTIAYEPVRMWVTGMGIAASEYEAAA